MKGCGGGCDAKRCWAIFGLLQQAKGLEHPKKQKPFGHHDNRSQPMMGSASSNSPKNLRKNNNLQDARRDTVRSDRLAQPKQENWPTGRLSAHTAA
jgi:hypothetical protein